MKKSMKHVGKKKYLKENREPASGIQKNNECIVVMSKFVEMLAGKTS